MNFTDLFEEDLLVFILSFNNCSITISVESQSVSYFWSFLKSEIMGAIKKSTYEKID